MRVPHNAFVLVADGRKSLFFRNDGDADYPNLKVESAQEHPNARDVDQKTDQAGRASSTQGGANAPAGASGGDNHAGGGGAGFAPSRGTMGEVDFHQQEEDRFAAETAAMLNAQAQAGAFEQLIIVAPPKTLGELRKHYGKDLTGRIAGELAKDLTGHSVPDIEKALANADA